MKEQSITKHKKKVNPLNCVPTHSNKRLQSKEEIEFQQINQFENKKIYYEAQMNKRRKAKKRIHKSRKQNQNLKNLQGQQTMIEDQNITIELQSQLIFKKREQIQNSQLISDLQLKKLRDMFTCPICYGILSQPSFLKECFHRFCKNCIDKAIRLMKIKSCPTCRCESGNKRLAKQDLPLEQMINSIFGNVEEYNEKLEQKSQILMQQLFEEKIAGLQENQHFQSRKSCNKNIDKQNTTKQIIINTRQQNKVVRDSSQLNHQLPQVFFLTDNKQESKLNETEEDVKLSFVSKRTRSQISSEQIDEGEDLKISNKFQNTQLHQQKRNKNIKNFAKINRQPQENNQIIVKENFSQKKTSEISKNQSNKCKKEKDKKLDILKRNRRMIRRKKIFKYQKKFNNLEDRRLTRKMMKTIQKKDNSKLRNQRRYIKSDIHLQ